MSTMAGNQQYGFRLTSRRSVLSRTWSAKRKRSGSHESDVSDEENNNQHSSQFGFAELLPEDARQRQVAGLVGNEELPGDGFPHRSQDYRSEHGLYIAPSRIQREISNLKPPLMDHIGRHKHLGESRSSLRLQHINSIHTVIHRCLLERDYLRAERAFRLLLRTKSAGKLPDLRKNNLWGTGAEILLHRREQASRNASEMDDTRKGFFNRDGLDDVRTYYEKLMIQFPYNKQRPQVVSSAHIYPAFFVFWIASIDAKYHTAVQSTLQKHRIAGENSSIDGVEELESIRGTILVSAQEIMNRLDEVLKSPPYSEDRVLWDLKGHIRLWLEDLSVSDYDAE